MLNGFKSRHIIHVRLTHVVIVSLCGHRIYSVMYLIFLMWFFSKHLAAKICVTLNRLFLVLRCCIRKLNCVLVFLF